MTLTESLRPHYDRVRAAAAPGTMPERFAVRRWSDLTAEERSRPGVATLTTSHAGFLAALSTGDVACFVVPDSLAAFDEFLGLHESAHAHEHYANIRRLDLGQANSTPRPRQAIWTARGLEQLVPLPLQEQRAGASYDPALSPAELYADAITRALAVDAQIRANPERLISRNRDFFGAPPFDAEHMLDVFAQVAAGPSGVEERIAAFWRRVDAMPAGATLTAADISAWALNLLERDPAAAIYVDDFRTCTREFQDALDRAAAA